jgi:hypothetical protein
MDFPTADIVHQPLAGTQVNVSLEMPAAIILELYQTRQVSAIYEAWVHIFRQLPPIPNVSKLMEDGNHEGLFSDLELAEESCAQLSRADSEYHDIRLQWVSKPKVTLVYAPSMVCCASIQELKEGSVFYFVANCSGAAGSYKGIINEWGITVQQSNLL